MEFFKSIGELSFDRVSSNGTLIVMGFLLIIAFIIYFFVGFYQSKKESEQKGD